MRASFARAAGSTEEGRGRSARVPVLAAAGERRRARPHASGVSVADKSNGKNTGKIVEI
jgi:hypothetical protein